jgi:hypothetical protein
MTLPTISAPRYTLTLPSSGKTVSYRPFLVKEEKMLLMAAESKDSGQITKSMAHVLNSCIDEKLDIDDLPMFDVEYLFLQLRSRSIGESIDLSFKCEGCDIEFKKKIDLSQIEVKKDDNHEANIPLQDGIGIIMKYPRYGDVASMEMKDESMDPMKMVYLCIDKIYDSEKVYEAKNYSESDLEAFIDSLNQSQMQKIQDFFTTMPKIECEIDYGCAKCNFEKKLKLNSLSDFFS